MAELDDESGMMSNAHVNCEHVFAPRWAKLSEQATRCSNDPPHLAVKVPTPQVLERRPDLPIVRNSTLTFQAPSLFDERGESGHTQSSGLWKWPPLAFFRSQDNHARMIGSSNLVQGKPTDFQTVRGMKLARVCSPPDQFPYRKLTRHNPCRRSRTIGFFSVRRVFEVLLAFRFYRRRPMTCLTQPQFKMLRSGR